MSKRYTYNPYSEEILAESRPGSDSWPTQPRSHATRDSRVDGSNAEDHQSSASNGTAVLEGSPAQDILFYQERIRHTCDDLRDFLLSKNLSYGNSAFEPIGVFSKLDAREGILLRIDDKLKRIRNGKTYPGDNDIKDLTGYLILLMVLAETER